MSQAEYPLVAEDRFARCLELLPPLPRIVQYEDDYAEKIRAVAVETCFDTLDLHTSGTVTKLHFIKFHERVRPLIRTYLLAALQTLAPETIGNIYKSLLRLSVADVELFAMATPLEAKSEWPGVTVRYPIEVALSLKWFVSFLCDIRFGHWTPIHNDFIRVALTVPGRDAYATVRSGDCFLGVDEEARLVRWLDEATLAAPSMAKSETEIACLVVGAYQMGMRPKQLGVIRKHECSVRLSEEDGSAIVHLQFRMLKQRDSTLSRLPLIRKVKREWAPLFVALWNHKAADDDDSFLFGFQSRRALSSALIAKLEEILPGAGRVAYDLRHSLAQRLVDSGAGHEEIAAALGHAELKTSSVYFRGSANQAELVNKALGVSDTYRTVAKIAAEKFIRPDELAALRGDQQVAGVPHGVPISGIGGCKSGQPSCPFNPVTACYGCPKFMPVQDRALHEQVLKDFRGIVLFYKDIGHGEAASPAYLQLQRTISEVQGVIRELGGSNG